MISPYVLVVFVKSMLVLASEEVFHPLLHIPLRLDFCYLALSATDSAMTLKTFVLKTLLASYIYRKNKCVVSFGTEAGKKL